MPPQVLRRHSSSRQAGVHIHSAMCWQLQWQECSSIRRSQAPLWEGCLPGGLGDPHLCPATSRSCANTSRWAAAVAKQMLMRDSLEVMLIHVESATGCRRWGQAAAAADCCFRSCTACNPCQAMLPPHSAGGLAGTSLFCNCCCRELASGQSPSLCRPCPTRPLWQRLCTRG